MILLLLLEIVLFNKVQLLPRSAYLLLNASRFADIQLWAVMTLALAGVVKNLSIAVAFLNIKKTVNGMSIKSL